VKMKLRFTLVFAAGCLAAALSFGREPARNVVIILADDLGYADVGYHGCKDVPTPAIDSIAKAGVRFTNGYVTAAVCGPTRAGLLSGRYQQRIGCEQNIGPFRISPDVKPGLPLEVKTMADRFKALGFATGCYGKWHLGGERAFDKSLFPTSRGFDEFFGFLEGAASYVDHENKEKKYISGTKVLDREPDYYTRALGREALAFLDRHKDERFFLYLPFNAVHAPMQAEEKLMEEFSGIEDEGRRKLAAMLSCMDQQIGRVLEKLREHGLGENTLVVFLSDNGGKPDNNFSLNHPLRGQKGTFFEGGIRIPFCMRWPARIKAGGVVDDPVISLDLLPTVIAAAGGKVGEDWKCEGIDLLPRLTGDVEKLPVRSMFWKSGTTWAIRRGGWKLVKDGRAEPMLFHLAVDMSEKNDLSSKRAGRAEQLKKVWDEWDRENVPAYFGWNKALGNEVERAER
jgi:arylsulfatase A-like enzyme